MSFVPHSSAMLGWIFYVAAGVALFASHVLLSWPPLRARLHARLGARVFFAGYGLVSTLALGALMLAFAGIDTGPQIFVPAHAARWLALMVMPLVVFLVLCRLTMRARRGEFLLPPRGIFRITRAPGSLAILLWAGLHFANTGDMRRLILFAMMGAIALWAIIKNEVVLARSADPLAAHWRSETALLPFAAGRAGDAAREIGWLRFAGALVLYGLLLALHPVVLGPDPLAGIRQ